MRATGWLAALTRSAKVSTGQWGQELETMEPVRSELGRVVYSRLSDAEAADAIRALVSAEPAAAQATARYVIQTWNVGQAYDIDRARRVLKAAVTGDPVEPIDPHYRELFERERDLGWLPVSEAFAWLLGQVPRLAALEADVARLAADPARFGIVLEADGSVSFPRRVKPHQERLVGPRSRHSDPLVRTMLAASVVNRYISAAITGTTGRPTWTPPGAPDAA